MATQKITLALPHYGREKVKGKSCFKVCERTAKVLKAADWIETPKARKTSYQYFLLPGGDEAPHASCPCVEMEVPTSDTIRQLANDLHRHRKRHIGTLHDAVVGYWYRDTARAFSFSVSQEPFWDVSAWWPDPEGEANWHWWEKGATYFKTIPPVEQRIYVRLSHEPEPATTS